MRSSDSLRSLQSLGTPPAGVVDLDLQVGMYVDVLLMVLVVPLPESQITISEGDIVKQTGYMILTSI